MFNWSAASRVSAGERSIRPSSPKLTWPASNAASHRRRGAGRCGRPGGARPFRISAHGTMCEARRSAGSVIPVRGQAGDADSGHLRQVRYLLHDRDSKFCTSFEDILKTAGVTSVPLPPRSPNLNAFAERWVRSVKEECLSKLILFGESSLKRAFANS
jgi:hypothetical protein